MEITAHNIVRVSIVNSMIGTVSYNGVEKKYSSANLLIEGAVAESNIGLFGSADHPFVDVKDIFLANDKVEQQELNQSMYIDVHDVKSVKAEKHEFNGHHWLNIEITSSRENNDVIVSIFPNSSKSDVATFTAKLGEMIPTMKDKNDES